MRNLLPENARQSKSKRKIMGFMFRTPSAFTHLGQLTEENDFHLDIKMSFDTFSPFIKNIPCMYSLTYVKNFIGLCVTI